MRGATGMSMKRRIIEAAICVAFVVVVLCSSNVNAQSTASSQTEITSTIATK